MSNQTEQIAQLNEHLYRRRHPKFRGESLGHLDTTSVSPPKLIFQPRRSLSQIRENVRERRPIFSGVARKAKTFRGNPEHRVLAFDNKRSFKERVLGRNDRLVYPFRQELVTQENLEIYFEILNNPQSYDQLSSLSNLSYNFLIHVSKLLLDFAKSDQHEHLDNGQLAAIRHFLWVLESINQEHKNDTGEVRWSSNLGIPLDAKDVLRFRTKLLTKDEDIRANLVLIDKALQADLTLVQPLSSLSLPPVGYGKRPTGPDNPVSTLQTSPREYNRRYNSAENLTEIKAKQKLGKRFNEFFTTIGRKYSVQAQFLLPHNGAGAADRWFLNKRGILLSASDVLTFSELKDQVLKNFLRKLNSSGWDETIEIGKRLLRLLERSQILLEERKDDKKPSYEPFAQLQIAQMVPFLQDIDDFVIADRRRRQADGELRRYPNRYRKLIILLYALAIALWPGNRIGSGLREAPSAKKLVEDFPLFISYVLSGDWKDDDESGFLIPESLANELNAYGGLSSLSDLGPYQYDGPENTQTSFSERLRLIQEESMIVIPGLSYNDDQFMPALSVAYSFSPYIPLEWPSVTDIPENPFAISWNSAEVSQQNTAPAWEKTFFSNTWSSILRNNGYTIAGTYAPIPFEDFENYDELLAHLTSPEYSRNAFYIRRDYFDLEASEERTLEYRILATVIAKPQSEDDLVPISVPPLTDKMIIIGGDFADYTVKKIQLNDGTRQLNISLTTGKSTDEPLTVIFLQTDHPRGESKYDYYEGLLSPPKDAINYDDHFYDWVFGFGVPISFEPRHPYVFDTPPPKVIEFINQWGIDYDQITQEITQEPVEVRIGGGLKNDQTTQINIEISRRINAAVIQQLQEKGVRYAQIMDINQFLTNHDLRSFFVAAETVGLDCDGLAFITSLTSNAYAHYMNRESEELEVEINWSPDGSRTEIVDLLSVVNNGLVLGELDLDTDNQFAGVVNHARVQLGSPMLDENFEATTGFEINDQLTPEDWEAFQEKLAALDSYPDNSNFKPEAGHFAVYISVLLGAILFGYSSRKILYRFLKKDGDLELEKLKGEAQLVGRQQRLLDKNEAFNRGMLLKITPRLKELDDQQLAMIPEILSYLLTDNFQSVTAKELPVPQKIEAMAAVLHNLQLRGTNKPGLEVVNDFKTLARQMFVNNFELDVETLHAQAAVEDVLATSTLEPKMREVYEVVQLMLKFKAVVLGRVGFKKDIVAQ